MALQVLPQCWLAFNKCENNFVGENNFVYKKIIIPGRLNKTRAKIIGRRLTITNKKTLTPFYTLRFPGGKVSSTLL